MAKASTSIPTPETHGNPAIAAAAAQIMTLINSRPASPREDEIAAIIEGDVPTAHSGQISDLDARIRKLVPLVRATELDACKVDDRCLDDAAPEYLAADAKRHAMCERLHALEREAYAKPAVTMADVQARATIAAHWADSDEAGDGSGPIEWLESQDYYKRALARLLEAVLQVGGRRGAPDGDGPSQEF